MHRTEYESLRARLHKEKMEQLIVCTQYKKKRTHFSLTKEMT